LPFQPNAHCVLADKLASVGLGDTFTDSRTEARRFFNQTQRSFLEDFLSRCAGISGNLRKLRFLFGGKLDLP
jgi:hypothetical protein